MSASQFGQYQRAESAQQNGFENIALFATALVAGNIARLPVSTLNTSAGLYLASRAIYNVLYINTESLQWSNLRTLVFLFGIGTIMTLFVKSGNALNLLL